MNLYNLYASKSKSTAAGDRNERIFQSLAPLKITEVFSLVKMCRGLALYWILYYVHHAGCQTVPETAEMNVSSIKTRECIISHLIYSQFYCFLSPLKSITIGSLVPQCWIPSHNKHKSIPLEGVALYSFSKTIIYLLSCWEKQLRKAGKSWAELLGSHVVAKYVGKLHCVIWISSDSSNYKPILSTFISFDPTSKC